MGRWEDEKIGKRENGMVATGHGERGAVGKGEANGSFRPSVVQ